MVVVGGVVLAMVGVGPQPGSVVGQSTGKAVRPPTDFPRTAIHRGQSPTRWMVELRPEP